jgi:hypothetical protein
MLILTMITFGHRLVALKAFHFAIHAADAGHADTMTTPRTPVPASCGCGERGRSLRRQLRGVTQMGISVGPSARFGDSDPSLPISTSPYPRFASDQGRLTLSKRHEASSAFSPHEAEVVVRFPLLRPSSGFGSVISTSRVRGVGSRVESWEKYLKGSWRPLGKRASVAE